MIVQLPDYDTYMAKVAEYVEEGRLSHTQLVILRNCYKASVRRGEPLHFNYLQKATNQTKEDCKWELNDLATKGAIRQIKPDWYML